MTTTTIPRVTRPRNVIPEAEERELLAARSAQIAATEAKDAADERLRAAVDAAYQAGGSHDTIAQMTKLAKSTVQKYATPRGKG